MEAGLCAITDLNIEASPGVSNAELKVGDQELSEQTTHAGGGTYYRMQGVQATAFTSWGLLRLCICMMQSTVHTLQRVTAKSCYGRILQEKGSALFQGCGLEASLLPAMHAARITRGHAC